MRVALLGLAAALAATTLPATPVEAQQLGFAGRASPSFHGGFTGGHRDGFRRGGFRHDRRRHRGFDDGVLFYDREYQGDTAWRPESFNDWWHERPNRSYPAWVSRNRNCEQMWWSGGDWRC